MFPSNISTEFIGASLLESHPLPHWVVDAQSHFIVYANAAAASLYGYGLERFDKMKFSQLFAHDNDFLFTQSFPCTNGQKPAVYEHRKRDGSVLLVQLFCSPFQQDDTSFYQVTAVETSKDVATEAKLKLLSVMVEETSDVLNASDLDFKPITWNKAAETTFGIKAEAIIGRSVSDILNVYYPSSSREEVRREVMQKGEWRGEMCFIRPTDQKLITLLVCFKLLKDSEGNPLHIISSGTDITARKEAESKLKESENRFREVAGSAPVMIWMDNEQGICTYANPSLIEFTGVDTLFFGQKDWEALIHPEDVEQCQRIYKQNANVHQPHELIYRLRINDGTYRWVKDVYVPRFLFNNKFIGYVGSIVDIDDGVKREQALGYQATILENISDIVTATDTEFKVTALNKAAETAYEYSFEEVRGKILSDIIVFTFHNSSVEEVIHILQTIGNWEGEVSLTKKDGSVVYFLYKLTGLFNENGERLGYLAIGRDITERRSMEDALQKSEQFYKALIADSANATLLVNKVGLITYASSAVKTLLQYEPEELIGQNAFGFVNIEDFQWANESFYREIDQSPVVKSITIRLKKKDGTWLWCMVRGHNMLSNPHLQSMVLYFHDDSVRKQANDALKLSEKRFRSLINELSVGLFMAAENGTILVCNPMLSTMLGLPEDSIVGKQFHDFLLEPMVDENDLLIPVNKLPVNELFSTQPIKDFVVGTHHSYSRQKRWVMISSKPILDDSGKLTHVICMLKDITARKEWEKKRLSETINHQRQLTQATIDGQEKERSEIGRELHDNIGQQLTSIRLFLDMMKDSGNTQWEDMVSLALKCVGDVINEVRSMSRSLVPHTLKDLGLVESVKEITDTLMLTQRLDVEFAHEGLDEKQIPKNQQLTLFRIIQEQLNNICKHSDARSASIQLHTREGNILLYISDDGKGFDTKKVRNGLGLTNITNRAELFGGKVSLVSEINYGTVLSVTMPVAK